MILAVLAFAMLIVSLDEYIVVVALPEIGRALDYSDQTLQSVISAYAVTSAGFRCWAVGLPISSDDDESSSPASSSMPVGR